MALTKYESYETGSDTGIRISAGGADKYDRAQTFQSDTAHSLKKVELKLYRDGTLDELTLEVRTTSAAVPEGTDAASGNALASQTIDVSAITASSVGEWVSIVFASPANLSADTTYALVLATNISNASNHVEWRYDSSSSAYANGTYCNYNGSWTSNAGADCLFKEYGGPTIADSPPSAIDYTKQLVAIGCDELWYESSAGTMAVLGASVGDLDVTENLTMCEAFQKIFIANKTNLKIADFINTKITTADILPAGVIPLKGDTLTATGGAASGAVMIVDYIDASDGACNVYGYRTSTATFVDTDVVTGSNANGDISFTLNADEIDPPHWYDWTVYANDATTYGTMPTEATIVCLYRGRLYLSGDSTRPHQWWLFKVDNPWSIIYNSTVPLSGVSGGDADVGEIGDIHTAAIPYKDDFLIQGCANSIWVIVGDPTAGGQLAEVSLTTGIWGSQAWCIDDRGNLYFLGNDGLYRVPIGISMPPPENISRLNLPNLISDLALDKALHRVVLGYDPFNYGIIISKVLLTSGANTGYWFDLTTQGFYPESYPNSCGIFSAFHYQATKDTYNKFLVGDADGYIREFDGSTENDIETDDSVTAINSYCTILQRIAKDSESEGKLTSLTAITAGGGSGGDTDKVTYGLYKGDSAEEVLNKITDGETAFATGSWTTVGKQNKVRQRMRGTWLGIKLSDNTASKTWVLERLFGNVEPAGKI